MEPKNRNLLVFAIAITLMIGIITSFGLPFFSQTPQITLSDGEADSDAPIGSNAFDPDSSYIPILVTADTVQAVVASMERSNSYYRLISVERWGSFESAATTSLQVWKDGDFERVSLLFPDGTSQNRLSDGSRIYLWRSGDQGYLNYPATQRDIDLIQELPTYERVIELSPAQITDASYDTKNGEDCIYVAYQIESLDLTERYWISTNTGLLYAAELIRNSDSQLKYRMTQTSIELNMGERVGQDATLFTLPDGSRLH